MKSKLIKQNMFVLLYQIDFSQADAMIQELENLSIKYQLVSANDLNQSVGYLAGIPGFQPAEGFYEGEVLDTPLMIFCGMQMKEMHPILQALKKKEVGQEYRKVMLTPNNQFWSLEALIHEITREHNYFQKMEQLSRLLRKIQETGDVNAKQVAEQYVPLLRAKQPNHEQMDRAIDILTKLV